MKLVAILGGIVAAVVILFGVYVRLAPSDPGVWHVDPRSLSDVPQQGRYLVRDASLGAADAAPPVFDGTPEEVLAAFDEIARGSPRTELLAGSVAEAHATYIARSRVVGFPDYITVLAYPVPEGTALAIYGRLRFGQSDLGVNQQRITGWLGQMPGRGGDA